MFGNVKTKNKFVERLLRKIFSTYFCLKKDLQKDKKVIFFFKNLLSF